jgi:hypothetical protein
MVKTIMDEFRHEFKSLSNDIKQVVKASQDKPSEKDKNNGYINADVSPVAVTKFKLTGFSIS